MCKEYVCSWRTLINITGTRGNEITNRPERETSNNMCERMFQHFLYFLFTSVNALMGWWARSSQNFQTFFFLKKERNTVKSIRQENSIEIWKKCPRIVHAGNMSEHKGQAHTRTTYKTSSIKRKAEANTVRVCVCVSIISMWFAVFPSVCLKWYATQLLQHPETSQASNKQTAFSNFSILRMNKGEDFSAVAVRSCGHAVCKNFAWRWLVLLIPLKSLWVCVWKLNVTSWYWPKWQVHCLNMCLILQRILKV